jgi:hypothetical protein
MGLFPPTMTGFAPNPTLTATERRRELAAIPFPPEGSIVTSRVILTAVRDSETDARGDALS